MITYAPQHARSWRRSGKGLLRFLTCGSVDDGKSTLIGRLLYRHQADSRGPARALERDSRKHGTTGDDIDFALLVDGLEAEREQGITIDVAYRFFATPRRSFIVADTPGHEQYTRNMATGASNCDAAVILIDARKGVLHPDPPAQLHLLAAGHPPRRRSPSTRSTWSDFRRAVFHHIVGDYLGFAAGAGFRLDHAPSRCRRASATMSPSRSERMRWYDGPTLLEYLEGLDVDRR